MKRRNSRMKLQKNDSRRTKKSTCDLVDSISTLPDSILSLILSSLPTKNAVATSILSKRWKFLWTTVINLDFSHEDIGIEHDEEKNMKFVGFVNRVLLHHDARLLLHKFRLGWRYNGSIVSQTSSWINTIPSQANSWINTAITRNVRQLVLSLYRYWRMGSLPFVISTYVFSCETLQSMELKGTICVPITIVVCLPRLETMKLVSVHFMSEEAFQTLIRGCPMLNYLHLDIDHLSLHDRDGMYQFKYIISSTSLRRLEICFNDDFRFCTPKLELETSSLEYLKIDGSYIPYIFVHGSLSSLIEAVFTIGLFEVDHDFPVPTYNSLVEVVRAFDCAKSLTLSTHVMRALNRATICLSTKFIRLTKLKARVDCFYCSSLEDFIQSSDNLEVLTIYQDSIERYLSDINLDENDPDHLNWTAPVDVPRCLLNSLKVVVFDGYSGSEDELEMIGYMLKHGSALESMQISCDCYMHIVKFELWFKSYSSSHYKVESSTSRFCEPKAGESSSSKLLLRYVLNITKT